MITFREGDRVKIIQFILDPEITIEAAMGLPIPILGIEGTVICIEEDDSPNIIGVLLDGYTTEIMFEKGELEYLSTSL